MIERLHTRWQDSRRRRAAKSLLTNLGIGTVSSIDDAVAQVGRLLGRRIVRLPLPERIPVGLSGLWLTCESDSGTPVDVILYRRSGEELGRQQDIGHELGHIVLRQLAAQDNRIARAAVRNGESSDDAATTQLLEALGDFLRRNRIDPKQVMTARREGTFGADEEILAEVIGSELVSRCQAGSRDEAPNFFGWPSE